MFEARSKSRFLASSLVPVLAIGALMVASSVAIITLQSNSAGQYRTAVELDELAIDTHHMFTSAWRAVLGSQPQPPYLTAEAYEVEKQYSIQLLSEAAAEYDNEVSERHDSDVRASLLAFGEQSKAALALLREGRGDEALGVIGQATRLTTRYSNRSMNRLPGTRPARKMSAASHKSRPLPRWR